MVRSDAETVDEYLAELPGDRRDAIEEVRETILEHLPEGFVESMNWGMISYEVPLETFPDTYNGQPLMHVLIGEVIGRTSMDEFLERYGESMRKRR